MVYESVDGPLVATEVLGYTLTGEFKPEPQEHVQEAQEASQPPRRGPFCLTPSAYSRAVDEHMLGSAEYTRQELADMGRTGSLIYERAFQRLMMAPVTE